MLLISLALTAITILLFRSTIRSVVFSASIASLIFLSFFLSGAYFVSDFITGRGIDESVFFHFLVDTTGVGIEEFSIVIAGAILYLVSIAIISVVTYKVIRTNYKVEKHKLQIVLGSLALLTAFFVNPGAADIKRVYADMPFGVHSEESKVYVAQKNLDQSVTKNVVYLYLESFERTYLDESLFPGLAPNLKKLEQESLTFIDVRQVYGTGWTIGGMVASQCGIPLVAPSGGNSMSGMDTFLSGATCLGDLLGGVGYDLSYMGGASLDFAGKGSFYRTHGFNQVEGLDQLITGLKDSSNRSSWGLFDDTLFEVLKEKYDKLSKNKGPFALFGLTLDTHHPNGHESKYCKQWKYEDGSNPILNAIHCTDKMVADFVEHIRNSKQYENTLVVLTSDHLAMRNSASESLAKGDRRNLFLIMGKDLKPKVVTKPASTLDISPTLLSLLGANVQSLGYGRNMLDEGQTLVEKFDDPSKFLRKSRTFLSSLWDFAELSAGLDVDLEQKRIRLGDRKFSYPALLALDNKSKVKDVYFEFYSPKSLLEQVSEFPRNQKFIWIDECSKTALFSQNTEKIAPSNLCLLIASLGAKSVFHMPLVQNISLSFNEIDGYLKKSGYAKSAAIKQVEDLKNAENIKKWGRTAVSKSYYKIDKSLAGDYLITSAGGLAGGSSLTNAKTGESTSVSRGLTLLGLNVTGTPIQIRHLDTCVSPLDQLASVDYSFQKDIDLLASKFGAFAIVAHDSAVCVPADFKRLFALTGLTEWDKIGYRTPYVAIISGNGKVKEFFGQTETTIVVDVKDFMRPVHKAGPPDKLRKIDYLDAVAHAGGGYKGSTYTNSIEALNANSKLYRLFEIDFSWTSDGNLVCLHDWDHSFQRSFNIKPSGKKSLAEFLSLVKNHSSVEKCTLDSLVSWLKKNQHARIVTDVKEENVRALEKIVQEYPGMINQFLPQVYHPHEYYKAKILGFKDVIWTLYSFGGTDETVLSDIQNMDLFALTMPRDRAERGLARRANERSGVLSYVHTVNSRLEMDRYLKLGVHQIYTDFLPQPFKHP